MSTLSRILLVSFLSLVLFPQAYSAAGSARVSKEVIALREAVPGLNEPADVDTAVNLFAALQMRVIGSNDPTWTRDNPNWLPVMTLVRQDLKKDIAPALTAQVASTALLWNRELVTYLQPRQVDELLEFYHSSAGRRYLDFQKRLMAIQVDGTAALTVAMASGGSDPKEVADLPPSAPQLESRKRVLALSWISQVTPAMGVTASPSHGASASDDKAISDMMADMIVKSRGPALDELSRQYRQDLSAFATFQQSSMAKSLILVYGDVAKETASDSGPGLAFVSAIQHSVELHSPAWKAAYESRRVKTSAVN